MSRRSYDLGLLKLPYLIFRILRSLLTHITLYGMLLILAPLVILFLLFFRKRFPTKAAYIWSLLTTVAAGIEVGVMGRHNLGKENIQVLIANHQSNFDVHALILALSPYYYRFVAKKELGWLPIFGWALWLSGFPLVDRKDNAASVKEMRKLEQHLKKKKMKVVIFPEGTRNKGLGLLPFKKGAFVLALNLQADIIPVIIEGAREIQHHHSFFVDPGNLIVKFLPPISTKGLTYEDRDSLMETAFNIMNEALPENEKKPLPAEEVKTNDTVPPES
jgi:1-acyl-sn-glycerol-3-phosphate acyltransferase